MISLKHLLVIDQEFELDIDPMTLYLNDLDTVPAYSQTHLVCSPVKSSDLLSLLVPSETIVSPLTIHVKSPS